MGSWHWAVGRQVEILQDIYASAVKFGIVLAVAHILVRCVLCRVENFSDLRFAQIYCVARWCSR